MKRYIKYIIPFEGIKNILINGNYKKIVFFIDFQSICVGLHVKSNIFFELNYYIDNNRQVSKTLITEYKDFLNNLYSIYKRYNPFFVTFYDDGKNIQNSSINSKYKEKKLSMSDIVADDDDLVLHYKIKEYYFNYINEKFTINNIGKVFYLKEYESDFIPYYCIKNNLYNSADISTLNIILSVDKDLLQCCQFNNTIQCTNRYFPSKTDNKKEIKIFNDENAIKYLDEKLDGLSSKYIPLILSISGDVADNINGIPGYKYIKAVKLIKSYNLPSTINEIKQLKIIPTDILNNINTVENAFRLIDFNEQLTRVGNKILIENNNISISDILNDLNI